MKKLLFLAALLSITAANAQQNNVGKIPLAYHEDSYAVKANPSRLDSQTEFDYEFEAWCPLSDNIYTVKVNNGQARRFRIALKKLSDNYARSVADGDIRNATVRVKFPKVDIYEFDQTGWSIKPNVRMEGVVTYENGMPVAILRTADFQLGELQNESIAQLIFVRPAELELFASMFESENASDLAFLAVHSTLGE